MELQGNQLIYGAELGDKTLVLLAIPKGGRDNNLRFVSRSGAGHWSEGLPLPSRITDVAVNFKESDMVVATASGLFIKYRPNQGGSFKVRQDDFRAGTREIRFIRNFGNELAVTGGMSYCSYLTRPGYPWQEITTPELYALEEPAVRGFEDVTKLGNALYFVGWAGAIWSYANEQWTPHDSPTDLMLGCAAANAEEDCVFAAGKMGTILQCKNGHWQSLKHDLTDMQIFDAATYNGATYFSGSFGILKYKAGELSYEKLIGDNMQSASTLFTGPSGLWSIGSTNLMLYDGDEWRVVLNTGPS